MYRYHVSFSHIPSSGLPSFGSAEITRNAPVTSRADVDWFKEQIQRGAAVRDVVVLTFQRYEEPEL